jgi:hypothetical protein
MRSPAGAALWVTVVGIPRLRSCSQSDVVRKNSPSVLLMMLASGVLEI